VYSIIIGRKYLFLLQVNVVPFFCYCYVPHAFLFLIDHSGGDSEQLEEEYHRLAGIEQSQIDSPILMQVNQSSSNIPDLGSNSSDRAVSTFANLDTSIEDGLGSQYEMDCVSVRLSPTVSSTVAQSTQSVILTEEQRLMIEAKRVEALKKRQMRMQQKAAPYFNPYAK